MDPPGISSSLKLNLALTKTTAAGISAAGGTLARTSDVTALRRITVYSSNQLIQKNHPRTVYIQVIPEDLWNTVNKYST